MMTTEIARLGCFNLISLCLFLSSTSPSICNWNQLDYSSRLGIFCSIQRIFSLPMRSLTPLFAIFCAHCVNLMLCDWFGIQFNLTRGLHIQPKLSMGGCSECIRSFW